MSDTSGSMFQPPECTACDLRVPATPLSLENPPGQKTLRYRIGEFVTFRQAMLDALTSQPVQSVDPANPANKRALTSRSPDDFAIATLEMWAYVCDVLTFYQQSIANESYLRTAVLRESLARIAALLGYEPARGASAAAWLAFFADKGAAPVLPPSLRTQSVPAPGSDPATFETAASIQIATASNQPVLLGVPQDASFTDHGELMSDAGGTPVDVGTKLLFYDETSGLASEHGVVRVTPASLGKRVQWHGDLGGRLAASTKVARLGRKFKYFGADAPSQWLKPDVVTSPPQTFTLVTMDTDGTNDAAAESFKVPSGSSVALDKTYDGLAVGGRVLLKYGSSWERVGTIRSVSQGSSLRGPLSGTCTVLEFNETLDAMTDLRLLMMAELLGDNLQFRATTNSDDIPAHSDMLYVADASGLAKGMQLLLTDGAASDAVVVSAAPSQGANDYWQVPITPELANPYHASGTSLYANVLRATHGETQREQVLGDGDASKEWQEFAVPVTPVTYLPDVAADDGVSSTLRVFVDDVEWKEVPSFYGRGGDEAIFLTRVDDAGKMYVRFGDGRTGRRVPTGSGNVRARMRRGTGKSGNVEAGSITVLLQPQPGLKSVVNPVAASGGVDPESSASVRQNAPSTVITLGRAVSLRDYEALSLSFKGGVAKARAAWAEFNSRRGVALTVAPAGGKPFSELVEPLRNYLDLRRDPNVPLGIGEAARVSCVFRALLHVLAGHKQSVVKAAARAALGPNADGSGYLGFEELRFGQSIFQSGPISVLQNVPGVEWVELSEFSCDVAHASGGDTLVRDAVFIGPGEIASPMVALEFTGGINDLEGV